MYRGCFGEEEEEKKKITGKGGGRLARFQADPINHKVKSALMLFPVYIS